MSAGLGVYFWVLVGLMALVTAVVLVVVCGEGVLADRRGRAEMARRRREVARLKVERIRREREVEAREDRELLEMVRGGREIAELRAYVAEELRSFPFREAGDRVDFPSPPGAGSRCWGAGPDAAFLPGGSKEGSRGL